HKRSQSSCAPANTTYLFQGRTGMPLYHHADASYMMHALLRRMLSLRAQVVSASLAALVLRLYLAMQFPADAGDSAIYEELARNWLDSHVYGLFFPVDLTPTDIRVPGYPGFLAIVYFFI